MGRHVSDLRSTRSLTDAMTSQSRAHTCIVLHNNVQCAWLSRGPWQITCQQLAMPQSLLTATWKLLRENSIWRREGRRGNGWTTKWRHIFHRGRKKKRFWKQVNRPFDALHDCGSLVDGRLETKTPPRWCPVPTRCMRACCTSPLLADLKLRCDEGYDSHKGTDWLCVWLLAASDSFPRSSSGALSE